jgi:hypothetical protein
LATEKKGVLVRFELKREAALTQEH